MGKEEKILSQLKLRKLPDVEERFFDDFFSNLMDEIELRSGILGQLKKAKKPEVVEGYFDRLPFQEPSLLDELRKVEKPDVPTGYFEHFTDNLIESFEDKTKKPLIIRLRPYLIGTSIAAMIALFFSLFPFRTSTGEIVVESTAKENVADYLSYLEEDDIVDFIVENEIVIEDESSDSINFDTYSIFSEEEIEDFYLEL